MLPMSLPSTQAPTKPWWQSKTIWFNVLSIVAGLGSIPFTGGVGPAVAIGSGVANVVLRAVTTQPVTTTSN